MKLETVGNVSVVAVGVAWLLFIISAAVDVTFGFSRRQKIGSRIFSRWRDLLWTFRCKGEPIAVYFYGPPFSAIQEQGRVPFLAHVHHRAGTDLVFETMIPALGTFGRLSIEYASYGTTWCWGHEGEEVEALAVSRALA